MAYEQKPDSGTLFKNDKKEKDTHADYRGEALIDGAAYYIDAWVNEIKNGPRAGKKFFGIKFKKKNQQSRQPSNQQQPSNDDIP